MFRLQGIHPHNFSTAVPEATQKQQLGNAMSLNVIERLLSRVLPHAKLTTQLPDRWETGEALHELWATCQNDPEPAPAPVVTRECYLIYDPSERAWIIDSGASLHIVNSSELT